eukprot:TRINITY_DN2677_c0_g3_i1.p1 TRINITY_DN2677_c0_g3~~TRINITY_DN2677_c0_g3_i1.p1  ORF type:complete len:374 (+),score=100.51 TRINITY_DN2677_c0_g3_i1:70-1191(+)
MYRVTAAALLRPLRRAVRTLHSDSRQLPDRASKVRKQSNPFGDNPVSPVKGPPGSTRFRRDVGSAQTGPDTVRALREAVSALRDSPRDLLSVATSAAQRCGELRAGQSLQEVRDIATRELPDDPAHDCVYVGVVIHALHRVSTAGSPRLTDGWQLFNALAKHVGGLGFVDAPASGAMLNLCAHQAHADMNAVAIAVAVWSALGSDRNVVHLGSYCRTLARAGMWKEVHALLHAGDPNPNAVTFAGIVAAGMDSKEHDEVDAVFARFTASGLPMLPPLRAARMRQLLARPDAAAALRFDDECNATEPRSERVKDRFGNEGCLYSIRVMRLAAAVALGDAALIADAKERCADKWAKASARPVDLRKIAELSAVRH